MRPLTAEGWWPYGQGRFRCTQEARVTHRVKAFAAVSVLAAVGLLAGVAAHAAEEPNQRSSSQCDLPVTKRTGGWLCPAANGDGGP